MWQKFKEQLPAVILTAAILLGAGFWAYQKIVTDITQKHQAELATMREQTNAEMKAANAETRRHIESVNQLLKDAISKRAADVFMTDEEVAKLNAEKVDALAEAIARKVQPYASLPKTPAEAEQMQNEQTDKISARMAEASERGSGDVRSTSTNDSTAAWL